MLRRIKRSDAYRKKGLWLNGAKGDYIDFYLNIKEEGNYVLTYKIKDSEAITNGFKTKWWFRIGY